MSHKINSDLIQLETLEKEFEVVLNQYEEAYQTYINNLNNPQSSKTFVSLKGRAYWGTYGLKEKSVSTQKECESMCASDIKCTGATFNPSKRYCWTRGGDGELTVGQSTDYAIVYELRNNIIILKNLNDRLIKIYNRIEYILNNNIHPKMEQYNKTKQQTINKLKIEYKNLLDERVKLNTVLQTLDNYNREYENTSLSVQQQNLSLRMWIIISLIVIFVAFTVLSGGNPGPLGTVVLIIIIIFVSFIVYRYVQYH